MIRNRAISLALVGLFVWVTGCTSYKQIELAEVADHGKVRVTLTDGERLVSDSAAVAGDSIRYWRKAERSSQISKVWVSSPLDQVVEVEAPRAGSFPIAVAVIVGVIIVGSVVCALACEFPFDD